MWIFENQSMKVNYSTTELTSKWWYLPANLTHTYFYLEFPSKNKVCIKLAAKIARSAPLIQLTVLFWRQNGLASLPVFLWWLTRCKRSGCHKNLEPKQRNQLIATGWLYYVRNKLNTGLIAGKTCKSYTYSNLNLKNIFLTNDVSLK